MKNEILTTRANLIIGPDPVEDRNRDAMEYALDCFKKCAIEGMDQAHAINSEYGNNLQVQFYMTEAERLFALAYSAAKLGMDAAGKIFYDRETSDL